MGWEQSNAFPLLIVTPTGGFTGLFFYSPVPGFGNLIESHASQGGTDPFGNAYLSGSVTYNNVTPFIAMQMNGFNIQWWTAPGAAGPWTANGPLIEYFGGAIAIQSGTNTAPAVAAMTLTSGATSQAAAAGFSSPLLLPNLPTPSNTLTLNASILYASGGHLKTVSPVTGGDGGTYGTERAVFTATGQLVNSLTPATVAGIGVAIPVAAAKYLIRGTIIILQGAAGAGHQGVRFVTSGFPVSNMNISFFCIEGATIFNSGVLGALSTDIDSGAVPAGTTAELHFDGIITFSHADVFGMQCDCITAAADTWTLSGNSYLELLPL